MSTPMSTIKVCSGVRLDNRYEHSIWFASPLDQEAFFVGKVVKTFPAYSYLRKSWSIKVQATMEEARTWNYLYFRNGTGHKVYYYFITNIEYINDNTVELALELDVLQTYMFDMTLLPSFIERQHTTTDLVGDHTLDEGLELGEFVVSGSSDITITENLCIMVLATINPNYTETTTPVPALSGMYNGVFSGLKVWAVPQAYWPEWGLKLEELSEAGFIDGIIAMWMYPQDLVELGGENTWTDAVLCKVVKGCKSLTVHAWVNSPEKIDGHAVKNNKLYTYPFNFLYMTNNAGASAVYRGERWLQSETGQFKIYGSASPDAGLKIAPVGYNGEVINYDEGLHLGDYPSCAWNADVYKLWLAQNKNQHAQIEQNATITALAGIGTMVGSIATGNVLGAVGGAATAYNAATQISNLMAQKRDAAIQPPQSRGNFSSSLNTSAGKQTFTVCRKTVDGEHARAIDDYFTMYGYKLNRVQTPNIHARASFTYVKTVGCHIQGTMCTEDIVKIESIFDNGVTFWVNGNRIADYSQDNGVLG